MSRSNRAATLRRSDAASLHRRRAAESLLPITRRCVVATILLASIAVVGCDGALSRMGAGSRVEYEPTPDLVGTLRAAAGATLSAASNSSDAALATVQPTR